MRSIQDIISEQKALVDIHIASYELSYINEHFMSNQDNYYLSEGFGETVKKAKDAVVKFIKAVIQKIKDFVKKCVGSFVCLFRLYYILRKEDCQ